MFFFRPVKKLSTQMTSCPSASNRSQRCEPRKPAPPVTRISFRSVMVPPGKRGSSEATETRPCSHPPRQPGKPAHARSGLPPASESGPVFHHPIDQLGDPGRGIDLGLPAQDRFEL